jgi:hypothetical protein
VAIRLSISFTLLLTVCSFGLLILAPGAAQAQTKGNTGNRVHTQAAVVRNGVAHYGVAGAGSAHDDSASCPSETDTCVQMPFPCSAGDCSLSAGPVADLGQGQAVYLQVSDIPEGDDIGVALCSLASGDQVVAQPQCASSIPPAPDCTTPTGLPCTNTASLLAWQYSTVAASSTVLSIETEYDPDISGAQPIVSQTAGQISTVTNGSFFCDNGPTNPCGIIVMDIPAADVAADVLGAGTPPKAALPSTTQNAVILPLTWGSSANGCGSAPIMTVDASYSAAQYLPAAGAATCTDADGVAVLGTDLPSVDDTGCTSGSGTHCIVTDVINGTNPVSFTDDPEDPTSLAEEKAAGGHFAYIPIALSATEIAFKGQAGLDQSGTLETLPLNSYELTPAQVAGIMTQLWTSPVPTNFGEPDDDICGQLTAPAKCNESISTTTREIHVATANGKTDNIDVQSASATGATLGSTHRSYTTYDYPNTDTFTQGGAIGSETAYARDSAYALLNPWPAEVGTTPVNETTLGAMFPSTASGAAYETTQWICAAPTLPFNVTLPWNGSSASVKDILTGQQVLANAERGPIVISGPPGQKGVGSTVYQYTVAKPSKCSAVSSLPTDFAPPAESVTGQYAPSSSPVTAAHAIEGAVPGYSSQGGFAFSAMDTSEADFYGLLPASLQNAAGSFVAPDETSIDAALNGASFNADGSVALSFDDTSNAAAYPMPTITYALVSTSPQPTVQQATELRDALTNLVQYSYSAGAGTADPLPSGYVPLTQTLEQAALGDIANDVVGPSGASSTTTTPPTTPAAGPTGAPGSPAGTKGASPTSSGSSALPTSPTGSPAQALAPAAASTTIIPAAADQSRRPFTARLLAVSVGDDRFFVPLLLLLTLLCLIAGPMVYLVPWRRRPLDRGAGGASLPGSGATRVGPSTTSTDSGSR